MGDFHKGKTGNFQILIKMPLYCRYSRVVYQLWKWRGYAFYRVQFLRQLRNRLVSKPLERIIYGPLNRTKIPSLEFGFDERLVMFQEMMTVQKVEDFLHVELGDLQLLRPCSVKYFVGNQPRVKHVYCPIFQPRQGTNQGLR